MTRPPAASSIQRVAVVVPARDEQHLLPGCLDALAAAAERVAVPVTVVVALDHCTDGTADVVRARQGVVAVGADAGTVGGARRLGATAALELAGAGAAPERVWLASTDADSRVPASWLVHHLALADDGVDLVLGTVDLATDDDDPVVDAWRREYRRHVSPSGAHSHVHGANLGVRASSYCAAGGFAPVAAHEDLALARSVARLPGTVVVATVAEPVVTSSRLLARAPLGVAADLRAIAAAQGRLDSTA